MKWRLMAPAFVLLHGVVVIVSWHVSGLEFTRHYGAHHVTMKYVTALMFAIGAAAVLCTGKLREAFTVFALGVLMYSLAGAYFYPGILPNMGDKGLYSIMPGVPSLGTLLAYGAFVGWLAWFDQNTGTAKYIGVSLILCGLVAIMGYALNQPVLYFYSKYSTAMALPTAVLFMMLGVHLTLWRQLGQGLAINAKH
jgi:hypothetical protein